MCPGLKAQSSHSKLTPQPSAINPDSENEPLFRTASINSAHHFLDFSSNHRSKSRRQKYFQGWRVGITACAVTTGAVLVVNTVLTIWASKRYNLSNFIGTIHEGNCDQAERLDLWLHLAINVLSTLLLSASNYSMQCLSSPTRAEINKAHREKRWLDIGVSSVRNLIRISWRRLTLWSCLVLSSIPLHLMYNSAVFSTLSTQQYFLFIVDADFSTGFSFNFTATYHNREWKETEIAASRFLNWLQDNISSLTRLDNAACIKAYGNEFVSAYGDLLLVSSTKNATNSVLFWELPETASRLSYKWMCSDSFGNENPSCDRDRIAAKADE